MNSAYTQFHITYPVIILLTRHVSVRTAGTPQPSACRRGALAPIVAGEREQKTMTAQLVVSTAHQAAEESSEK